MVTPDPVPTCDARVSNPARITTGSTVQDTVTEYRFQVVPTVIVVFVDSTPVVLVILSPTVCGLSALR